MVAKRFTEILTDKFAESTEFVMNDPCLFGDFMLADPANNNEGTGVIDPKLYEDCGTYEKVGEKFNNLLLDYNEFEGNKEMSLVLFNDALFHLSNELRANDILISLYIIVLAVIQPTLQEPSGPYFLGLNNTLCTICNLVQILYWHRIIPNNMVLAALSQ